MNTGPSTPAPRTNAGVPAALRTAWPPDVRRLLDEARQTDRWLAMGRHAGAERSLRALHGALTRRGAWAPAAEVAHRLGALLLERGRWADARDAFAQARGAADGAGADPLAVECQAWMAWGALCGTRTREAGADLAPIVDRAPAHEPAWSTTTDGAVRAVQAAWLMRTGDEAGAAALLEPPWKAGGEVAHSADAWSRATAGALAVKLLVRAGRLFEAGRLAQYLRATRVDGGCPRPRVALEVAHLHVLAATGDTALFAVAGAPVLAAARALHLPLLHREARSLERGLQGAVTGHGEPGAHPCAVDVPGLGPAERHPGRHGHPGSRGVADGDAVALLQASYREEDDEVALAALAQDVVRRTGARAVLIASPDGAVAVSAGTGRRPTVPPNVLDPSEPEGASVSRSAPEHAEPVWLAGRLVGVVVGRWVGGAPVTPDARAAMALAGCVAAPRLETLSRHAAAAAPSMVAPELVGQSTAMAVLREAVRRAAASPFGVLIEGESGVGKELVARALHRLSTRHDRPFRDLNCAALPDELVEAELFGHARGAYTGALVDRSGLFEEASGGTLFLDELPDLSMRAQAKLLRALQQREVRRLGEITARTVDVRVVAATNRPLAALAAEGRFRHDLLYRLDVVRLRVPALRERPEDVPLLAEHFWREAAARAGTGAVLSPEILGRLAGYAWPGNVRELQNVVASLAVAAPPRGVVRAGLLPPSLAGAARPPEPDASSLADARQAFERRLIQTTLARAGGCRTQAAARLGLSRQGLLKLMARLGVTGGREQSA